MLGPLTLACVVLMSLLLMSEARAQPQPFACDGDGLLFQYPGNVPPTQVRRVDMVTGDFETDLTLANRRINAVGYNVLDNFVYGWDIHNSTLVRVGANGVVQQLNVTGGVPGTGRLTGDVDENGHFWMTGSGGAGTWVQINLNTNPPQLVDSGLIQGGGIGNFAQGPDWAYVPGAGNYLYRIMAGQGESWLFRFNRTTKLHENLGSLGTLGTNQFGAVYADAGGFLYISNNASGVIYRVDIGAVEATVFTQGPASDQNDGARCANAPLLLDFGDAPDSYGTLLASNGARHQLVGYLPATNTTPLMLGAQVDPEDDGQPSPGADADDFDDGVIDPITFLAGQPTVVEVIVTNDTDQPATLAGWLDLHATGSFDPGDRAPLEIIPASSGTQTYTLTFPAGTASADVYARFRVFPGMPADPQPLGPATGGEVEDYLVLAGSVHFEKTIDPPNPLVLQPGDTFTYTVTVTNTGSVPLTGLSFTDDLSGVLDDATYVLGSETASIGLVAFIPPDQIQWTGDLDIGEFAEISYQVTIDDPPGGDAILFNGVIGEGPGSNCPPPGPPSDPDCFKQVPQPFIESAKTVLGPADPLPGDVVFYQFTVSNVGTGPAFGVQAIDDLTGVLDDAVFNDDAAADSGDVTYDPVEQQVVWTGSLNAGETATITYSVTVNAADEMGDGVLLNALLAPGCPAPPITDPGDPGFDPDCVTLTPVEAWTVSKQVDPAGAVSPGSVVSYTLIVSNTGGTALAGIAFSDDLSQVLDDALFNDDEAADVGVVDYLAPVLSWSGDLAVGQTATITYSVTVNAAEDLGDGVLLNAVTGAPNCPDPAVVDPGDPDFNPDCVSVTPVMAWRATKTSDNAGPVAPGDVINYQITVANIGGADLVSGDGAAVSVSDDLSGVLDDATYNDDAAATLGTVDYAEPVLTWGGDLLVGETAVITYSVTVNAAGGQGDGLLTNAVLGAPNCPDPPITDPGDPGFDPDCVVVVPTQPELSVAKSIIAESGTMDGIAEPGEVLTFSIRVSNSGGSDAIDVLVNEVVPANTTYEATGSDAWSCADGSVAGTACDFVIPTVPANGFVDLLFRVRVDDPIPPGVVHIANAVALDGEDPPDCPPDSDPACVVIPTEPQTVISKALTGESMGQNGQAEAGEVLTYTLTLQNHGGSDDLNVIVNETVPDHTTTAAGNQLANGALGDWSCVDGSAAGTACDFLLPVIGAGETVMLTFMVLVDDPIPDGVTEIANAVALNGEDPVPCPPSSPQCVVTPTEPSVSVVKALFMEDGEIDGAAEAGEILVYELTVTNSGGSTAFDQFLREIVPQYTTFLADPESSPGWDCADGSTNPAVCDLVFDIGAGEVLSFLFAVQVDDPLPDGVTQIANAVGLGGNPPPCPPAGVQCVVIPTVPDVGIAKVLVAESGAVDGQAEPGEQLTYEITLTNTGGMEAADYVVIDQLDANVIFISADNGGVHDGAATGGEVSWTVDVPAANGGPGIVVLTVVVEVVDPIPPGVTQIGNVAYNPNDGPPDCADDPVPPNCTEIPTVPEVSIAKALVAESGAIDGQAEAGEQLTYEITLTNSGGSVAVDYDVIDQLDPNVIFVSADNGGVHDGAATGGEVSWTVDVPAANGGLGEWVLTVVVEVVDPIPAGVTHIGNVAYNPDEGPPDCTADPVPPQCTTIPTVPEVSIAKALVAESGAVDGQAEPGEQLTYEITLTNSGGSVAVDYDVIDQLDPNVIFVSADSGGVHNGAATGGEVVWTVDIPAGGSMVLTLVVEVVTPIPPGVTHIGNVAYNPNDGPPDCADDPVPPNCTETPVDPRQPVVTIVKQAEPSLLEAGEDGVYALVIEVAPDSIALGAGPVTVTDPMPAPLEINGVVTGTDWDCSASTMIEAICEYTGAYPILPGQMVGGEILIPFTVPEGSPASDSVLNVATVTYGPDSDTASADATIAIGQPPPPLPVPANALWMLVLMTLLLMVLAANSATFSESESAKPQGMPGPR